jgi:hypothetical protein
MNGIVEDLRLLADEAGEAPPGLAETVSRRYRRRRVRRTGLTAVCAAAAVAAAVAVPALLPDGPPIGRGSVTAAIPSGPGIWKVPALGATLPTLAQTWPSAVVNLPATPDGGTPTALGGLGDGRALVASNRQLTGQPASTDALYAYQPGSGYRQVAEVTGYGKHFVAHFAASAHRLYWGVEADGGFDVYSAPLAGGTPTHLAFVPAPVDQQALRLADGTRTGPWFATDDAVYWSGMRPGVMRLAATGGSVQPVAGFTDAYLLDAGSPWASTVKGLGYGQAPYVDSVFSGRVLDQVGITTRMRNVQTGATIEVQAPDGATAMRCAPTLCVGVAPAPDSPAAAQPQSDPRGISFIQRPDGRDLAQLSSTLPINDIYTVVTVHDRGYLVSGWIKLVVGSVDNSRVGWVVGDPLTGVAAADRSAGVASGVGLQTSMSDGALGYPVGAGESIIDFFLWANID